MKTHFGGHFGRHLRFLKTLKGAKPAPDEILKSIARAWCKTIVTTSFYIRSYNSFAPSPRMSALSENTKYQTYT